MIENIKRIVNEHHTLIVVIIAALVICFLYWWFCCKDRPSTNKANGGRCAVYFDKEFPEIQFIGKKLERHIPMLSRFCVEVLSNNIEKNKQFGYIGYLPSSFISYLKIPTILEDPLKYLIDKYEGTIQSPLYQSLYTGLKMFDIDTLAERVSTFHDSFDFDSIMKDAFPSFSIK